MSFIMIMQIITMCSQAKNRLYPVPPLTGCDLFPNDEVVKTFRVQYAALMIMAQCGGFG